jgi:ATP-binding cassette subfamily B protein
LLPLPILSFVIYYVESIIQRKSDLIQRQLSKLTTFTQEVFSGIRVVKAYVKEEESSKVFAKEADDYKEKSVDLAKITAIFIPAIIFLAGTSTLLVVWIGGNKIISGALTVGNIAEFIIYIGLLTWPIIAVGWVTTLIQRAAASQVRLNELLAERAEIRFPETGPALEEASIEFSDVNFTYADTGIEAIKNISFTLKAGQKLGILGPTGSGKSTLCALIPRLFDIDHGEIKISGHDIKQFSLNGLRSELGYAPQDVFLFSDTVANNIAFGKPDATQAEIEAAAKSADIYDNILGFKEQFQTFVGERGVTLSGGQKQRISVARAWIRHPKLLILDDVLSAVDARTEENILQGIRQYRKDNPTSSVIMVAHRISCLQDADHIIVLENGKLTQQGTHQELINQEGYYLRIYEKQLLEENREAGGEASREARSETTD